jgi:hypothetical protein
MQSKCRAAIFVAMAADLLLPACYFGTVEHYALIARYGRVVIDTGEHYERQSYRTRTTIQGPNGRQDLLVYIARRSGEKMPMRSVGLSYDEPWHRHHVQAIRSAYGQSPWFIHYIDDVEALLLQRHQGLAELNLASMWMALRWLGLSPVVEVSPEHVEPGSCPRPLHDLRTALHPKRALPPDVPQVGPYPQVFADRHGFQPRLSILDLVMNTGPDAAAILAEANTRITPR